MNSTADLLLRLDWCNFAAAKYACERWHYSRSLPASKRVHIGVWEDGHFIGATVFSRGNTPNIGAPFQLRQNEICELTRVALREHQTPTSRIVAIALRMLKRQSPGVRLVVSFADPMHGHVGTLYQAGGWWYVGETHRECLLRVHGRLVHPRSVGSRYGHRGLGWIRAHVDPKAERIITEPKFKYLLPLDDAMRAQLAPLRRPYPQRERSAGSGTAVPTAGGVAIRPARSPQSGETTEAAHV